MVIIFAVLAIFSTALLGASIPFGNTIDSSTQTGTIFNDPAACRPTLENDTMVKVQVDPSVAHLYTAANPANDPEEGLDFDKTDDEWILVKRRAPIPAWKAALITHERGDDEVAEMERVGTVESLTPASQDSNGKEVYIGTGWCDPETGENFDYGEDQPYEYCLDPLVQDVIFVVDRQATAPGSEDNQEVTCDSTTKDTWLKCFDWGAGTAPAALYEQYPRTQQNIDKYYWMFDVYYKEAKLPADATTEDLPCWIETQCYQNLDIEEAIHAIRRREKAATPNCEVVDITRDNSIQIAQTSSGNNNDVLGFTVNAQNSPAVLSSGVMDITNPPGDITMAENYLFSSSLSIPPDPGGMDELIGVVRSPLDVPEFNIYLRRGNVEGETADHALILDPAPAGDTDGPYLMYIPLLGDSKPNAKSLQLGSFIPGIPSYFYEWWTPSCKPALYLYPEKEVNLSVTVHPNGYITESIPPHGEQGWNIVAKPDGTILEHAEYGVQNTEYSYLYYEAAIKNITVPKDRGWIKTTDQFPVFFADILPKLGLNEKESQDFLDYWLPKLTSEGNRWFITLIDEDEVNRVEPVSFSVQPDNFLRIRFYFENIDQKIISPITAYHIPNIQYERSGFTVIDWGGILGNGSCGLEETSR